MFKPTGDAIDIAWEWNSFKERTIGRELVTCDFWEDTTRGY